MLIIGKLGVFASTIEHKAFKLLGRNAQRLFLSLDHTHPNAGDFLGKVDSRHVGHSVEEFLGDKAYTEVGTNHGKNLVGGGRLNVRQEFETVFL